MAKEEISFKDKAPIYINKDLYNYDNTKDLLLIAFGMTHPAGIEKIKELWKKHDSERKAYGRSTEDTKRMNVHDVGGAISLVDIDFQKKTSKLLVDMHITTPMGLLYYKPTEELLVGSAYSIKAIKSGRISRNLNNSLFNTIHTIKESPHGIYVVSTATDSILEIDPRNPSENIWDWLATENGYNYTRSGNRKEIRRDFNYQTIDDDGSSTHTTHVNGVETYDSANILATLFHQDKIIKINKKSKRSKTVFSDLTNPHGIHKIEDGFIVSDTRGGRVFILDNDFQVRKRIEGDFDWIQDSIKFNNYYIIGNDNKGRLEIIGNNFSPLFKLTWGKDLRKMSTMIKIKAKDAKKAFLQIE